MSNIQIVTNNKMQLKETIKVMKVINDKAKDKIRQLETEKKELKDLNDELIKLMRRAEENMNKMRETITTLRNLKGV